MVSDDHRLQQAARRRQCPALGCLDFLEELERHRRLLRRPPRPGTEKQESLSEKEKQDWESEFAALDDDPDMKELFNPYDFQIEDEDGG